MTIDERLTEAFRAKAATANPSPEAFDIIRTRTRSARRIRTLQAAAIALAVPALAVGAVLTLSHRQDVRQSPVAPPTTQVAPAPLSSTPGQPLPATPTAPRPPGSIAPPTAENLRCSCRAT